VPSVLRTVLQLLYSMIKFFRVPERPRIIYYKKGFLLIAENGQIRENFNFPWKIKSKRRKLVNQQMLIQRKIESDFMLENKILYYIQSL
jgi:hypothetical protein